MLWNGKALQMGNKNGISGWRWMKICPNRDEPIEAIILTWPNQNTGLIVVCNVGSKTGHCPINGGNVCLFPLNPERMYAVNDPRFLA